MIVAENIEMNRAVFPLLLIIYEGRSGSSASKETIGALVRLK